MKKKFLSNECGVKEAFWDRNWEDASIEDTIKYCEISPLKPIFDSFFPKQGKILEGGCGLGQFVIYYRNKGYDIEGVDSAPRVIERILAYDNTVKVQKADILNLPYPGRYFSAYYSGGVVEHFEDGPYQALREAHRVLNKTGIFIVTVPYFNPLRRLGSYFSLGASGVKLDFNEMKTRYLLTNSHQSAPSPFVDFSFLQYEYTKKEFSKILNDCGFTIVFSRGISIIWGLMDSRLLRGFIKKFLRKERSGGLESRSRDRDINEPTAKNISAKAESYLKKMLISEDYSLRFGSWILKVLQSTCANLILFICRVNK